MGTSPWDQFNCYEVLGVTASASPQDIKRAWREASMRHHPDRGGSHEVMIKMNAAYAVLSDPVHRVSHDLRWRVGGAARPRSTDAPGRAPSTTEPLTSAARASRQDPLSAFKARLQQRIAEESQRIRQSFQQYADEFAKTFRQQMSEARRNLALSFASVAACTLAGLYLKPAFIGSAIFGLWLVESVRGPTINSSRRFPLNPGSRWLTTEAERSATERCGRETTGLERYYSDLATILGLVLRPSTFDESESQVARRITTTFFLLGYAPIDYSAVDRTLRFSDGDDELLVRFRHRGGAPVNVTYVEKLIGAMRGMRIKRGYLFCSPGLSGNAAALASENGVGAYTLETMGGWVDEVLDGDYAGPAGDTLAHLDALKAFLGRLSNALPGHTGIRSHGRRRRRPW